MEFVARIRSFCFDVIFYGLTIVLFILLWPSVVMLPRGFCVLWYRLWTHSMLYILKIIVGLDYKIVGKEKLDQALKNGPVILACKHESAWDTLIFSTLVDEFVIVLKKQLLQIPGYRNYLIKLSSIVIDRSDAIKSIKSLLKQGREAIAKNRSILIFPEGRRGNHEDPISLKSGISLIYKELNVPVVPVALNSGKFWARRSAFKKSGCITLEFLDPIPSGLPKDEFTSRLQESINTACARI